MFSAKVVRMGYWIAYIGKYGVHVRGRFFRIMRPILYLWVLQMQAVKTATFPVGKMRQEGFLYVKEDQSGK